MVVCHYGCDVVVGSLRWFGSAALARQSCDADQTRRLPSPSKDGLGWDLCRRLAFACGPTPAVQYVVCS
jgi:hypothetical protein